MKLGVVVIYFKNKSVNSWNFGHSSCPIHTDSDEVLPHCNTSNINCYLNSVGIWTIIKFTAWERSAGVLWIQFHIFYFWGEIMINSLILRVYSNLYRKSAYSYLLNKRACPFIYFRKKFHPRHARLLGFEKNSSLDMIFYVVKKIFHPPRLPNFAPLPVY